MLRVSDEMQGKDPGDLREQKSTWTVALSILGYLNQNPHATDTASGILEWWLLKQSINEEQNLVRQALDTLVERNLILSVRSADGRKHYRLNPKRVTEARRLIQEAKDREIEDRR
jgi:hypothetical protein